MIYKTNAKRVKHMALALICICALSASTSSHASESTITVNGKTLKHLGKGLREFLFVDIYNLDAFSESGDCDPGKIVYNTETKMMRLSMIRNIPISRLKQELGNTFKDNMPKKGDPAALQKKIDKFLTYFKNDLSKGSKVEISFSPGKGCIVKQNGKTLGPAIPGRDFAELVWRSYFGGNTCCKNVKKAVIKQCKAGK